MPGDSVGGLQVTECATWNISGYLRCRAEVLDITREGSTSSAPGWSPCEGDAWLQLTAGTTYWQRLCGCWRFLCAYQAGMRLHGTLPTPCSLNGYQVVFRLAEKPSYAEACRHKQRRCWLRTGHGTIELRRLILQRDLQCTANEPVPKFSAVLRIQAENSVLQMLDVAPSLNLDASGRPRRAGPDETEGFRPRWL